jgi:hypothetical protein
MFAAQTRGRELSGRNATELLASTGENYAKRISTSLQCSLIDPDNGDFRLAAGSPCIDAADNTAVPVDITTDLDGNPRFAQDPCTFDTGNPDGTNPPVDIGAYEFQPPCPPDL